MSATSFYALEMAIAPGGGRHADCFVHHRAASIASLLNQAFAGQGSCGPSRFIVRLVVENDLSVVIWVVQRGRLEAAVDLAAHIQARLDDGKLLSLLELRREVSEPARVMDFEFDAESIAAALPPLEPPLLRPGWVTLLRRQPQAIPDPPGGMSYFRDALRKSWTELRHGYQSFEESDIRGPFHDPDPPSEDDLRERLRRDEADVEDVLERALGSDDLELAAAAIERLAASTAQDADIVEAEARARLDRARREPARGLLRLARLATARGVGIEALELRTPALLTVLRDNCSRLPGQLAALLAEVREGERDIAERRATALREQGNCQGPALLLRNLAEVLPWPTRGELLGAASALYARDPAIVEAVRTELDEAGSRVRSVGGLSWALLAIAYERRDQPDEALAAWTRASKLEGQALIPKLGLARLSGRSIDDSMRRGWRALPGRGHEVDQHMLGWLAHDEEFDRASLGPPGESQPSKPAPGGLSLEQVSIGAKVVHGKFGVGIVTAIQAGSPAKLVIEFEGDTRTLLLRFVELA